MKSKTYCSKFIKASFVKQLWVMGLMAFVYFLALPVPLAVMMTNWTDQIEEVRYFEEQFSNFMLQADPAYVLLVAAAIFTAFVQFSYLHSRRQLDFYGSLSVRRESLFSQRLSYGFIDFAVPYTLMLVLCLIVGAARGLVTGSLIVYLMESWLYSLIGFLLIYFVAALAILLTGRPWVAVMGSGVLLSGGFLLQILIIGANSNFFDTYYYIDESQVLSYLSPVYLLYELRGIIFSLENKKLLISAEAVILPLVLLLICVLLLFLLRFLVRIRPTEKAGQSMAFEIPARVIHVGLSIFCGFAIGMFAQSVVYVNDTLWFFMGTIFGSICMYVLIQFIYTLDIRRTFTYKWQILVVEGVLLLICSIYSFDLLGYDEYLPKQGSLKSVAIRYGDDNAYNEFYIDGKYYAGIDYSLENIELPADDITYGMLAEVTAKHNMYVNRGRYDGDYDLDRLYVKYRLQSGREVERMYMVPMMDYKDEFIHFYDQESFRGVMVPSLMEADARYTHLTVYYAGEEHLIYSTQDKTSLDTAEVQRFMEAYNRDMKALDSRTFIEDMPVAKLYSSAYAGDNMIRRELRVYEDCKETLALLKQMGYDPFAALEPEKVVKIEIDDYSYQYEEKTQITKEGEVLTEAAAEQLQVYTVTDTEQIQTILNCMVEENYYSVWFERAEEYHICVYMGDNENGYEIGFWGDFLADQVPTELLEELEPTVVY